MEKGWLKAAEEEGQEMREGITDKMAYILLTHSQSQGINPTCC